MTDPSTEDDLHVHLTVDGARTAQLAGTTFARTLAGAHSADFALALAEQADLIERATVDAGYSAELAEVAAEYFEVAACDEWARIEGAGCGFLGTA